MAIINKTFKKAIKKNKTLTYTNNTANFIKQNKERELMREFLRASKAGRLEECMSIQKTTNRDRWGKFPSTSKARDLSKVFQYLARADGRKTPSYHPSCIDPLWSEKQNKWRMAPKAKANLLGQAFEEKMTQTRI